MGHTWAAAGVSLLLAGLVACAPPSAPADPLDPVLEPTTTAEPEPSPPAAPATGQDLAPAGQEIAVVRLATGSSSAVIKASSNGRFSLVRSVDYDGPEPGPSHRIDGTTLVLTGCELPDCWFEYQVTVPAGVRVEGEAGSGRTTVVGAARATVRSGSGSVKLTDIAGPVDVTSDSGPVSLNAVRGDVLVATGSGPITGDALGAATTVESGSGPVRLAFASAATVRATTANGPIHIAVPTGRYDVTTDSLPHYTAVEVTDEPGAPTVISARSRSGPVTVTSTTR